jgi:hypothetical protein
MEVREFEAIGGTGDFMATVVWLRLVEEVESIELAEIVGIGDGELSKLVTEVEITGLTEMLGVGDFSGGTEASKLVTKVETGDLRAILWVGDFVGTRKGVEDITTAAGVTVVLPIEIFFVK